MQNLIPGAKLALVLASLAVFVLASPAYADSAIGSHHKTFGIGLEAGHGAGLSLKYQSSAASAWQFGLYSYDYRRYRDANHGHYYYAYDYGYGAGSYLIHVDYLASQANLSHSGGFSLPWYVGGGGDLGLGGGTAIGIHGDVGLALQFSAVPIDLFVEWTPRLWLVDFVQLHPLDFNGGVRVWF